MAMQEVISEELVNNREESWTNSHAGPGGYIYAFGATSSHVRDSALSDLSAHNYSRPVILSWSDVES